MKIMQILLKHVLIWGGVNDSETFTVICVEGDGIFNFIVVEIQFNVINPNIAWYFVGEYVS